MSRETGEQAGSRAQARKEVRSEREQRACLSGTGRPCGVCTNSGDCNFPAGNWEKLCFWKIIQKHDMARIREGQPVQRLLLYQLFPGQHFGLRVHE